MNDSLMRFAKDNPRKVTTEDAQFLQALSEIASALYVQGNRQQEEGQ